MNFLNLQNKLWLQLGYPDTANDRRDARLQDIKDALNETLQEICATCSPRLFALEREGSLSIVSGTSDYTLDDYCQRPLAFRDSNGMPLTFHRKKNAEQDGLYVTQTGGSAIGGFEIVPAGRSTSAYYSGAAAAATGATVANAATTVAFGASVVMTTAMTGRMIRFNGEPEDYVFTYVSATSGTLDRAFKARISGVGTSGAGSTYTAVRFEVGPKLRYKIKILPTVTAMQSVTYRYMAYPRRMIENDDEPEINDDYHRIIWMGALKSLAGAKKFLEYTSLFDTAMLELIQSDDDEAASDEPPTFGTLNDDYNNRRYDLPGIYRRY